MVSIPTMPSIARILLIVFLVNQTVRATIMVSPSRMMRDGMAIQCWWVMVDKFVDGGVWLSKKMLLIGFSGLIQSVASSPSGTARELFSRSSATISVISE